MKCQLIGFSNGTFTNNKTGEVVKSCILYFVRKPNLRESNVEGNVACVCSVYNDSVDSLPDLEVGKMYDCEIVYSKGRNYLNDMKV